MVSDLGPCLGTAGAGGGRGGLELMSGKQEIGGGGVLQLSPEPTGLGGVCPALTHQVGGS